MQTRASPPLLATNLPLNLEASVHLGRRSPPVKKRKRSLRITISKRISWMSPLQLAQVVLSSLPSQLKAPRSKMGMVQLQNDANATLWLRGLWLNLAISPMGRQLTKMRQRNTIENRWSSWLLLRLRDVSICSLTTKAAHLFGAAGRRTKPLRAVAPTDAEA
jgi:hypothetical protein